MGKTLSLHSQNYASKTIGSRAWNVRVRRIQTNRKRARVYHQRLPSLDNHRAEWLNSGIDPEIIAQNVRSLSGNNPYDYLLYGLDNTQRRNDGRLTDRWLKAYRHIEDGGWWCAGLNILTGQESPWGCFKPDKPRYDSHNHKLIKYEHPVHVPTEIFCLQVPIPIGKAIADKHCIDKDETQFWQWVIDKPDLPIIITEGAKKAGAILTAGYVAIALPGIFGGYRNDGQKELIPQLKPFCKKWREIIFAFDQDKKYKTKQNVIRAICTTGKLFQEQGCKVSVLEWDAAVGKGIDDAIASSGIDWFEALLEKRLSLCEYEETKNKKSKYLDTIELLEFLEGEFEKRLSFDETRSDILLDGKPIKLDSELKSWFAKTYGYRCSLEDLESHLAFIAKQNSFNPVKQYLERCHSNATRISIDNLATRYFGSGNPLYNTFVRKWLIGAVTRAFDPGCQMDYALILLGKNCGCDKER